MKQLLTLFVLASMASNLVQAAQSTTLSCNDFRPTPAALDRFPELVGACQGVVEINGELYAKFEAVVRRVVGRALTLYIPAVDRTMRVTPPSNALAEVSGRKVRMRDLARRQEISIYLSISEFAEPVIDELAFITEENTLVEVDAEPVAALPTTASPWPLIALFGALMLGGGTVLRRIRIHRA